MENKSYADLLAGAALLITCVTILYSLWYVNIEDALSFIPEDAKPLNDKNKFDKATTAVLTRALPLALASFSIALALVPDTLHIIGHASQYLFSSKRIEEQYDAVQACVALAAIFVIGLAVHIIWLTVALINLRRRLNPSRPIK
jgi:hypothetical protein